jgi:4-amino-4-deoxy-L-arabinose transferase-like glycosyltransferase
MATCVEYVMLSRACITDMLLTAMLALGCLFFCYGYLRGKNVFYLLSSASFGLAVLTKGPAYIILGAGAILLFLALNRDLKAVARMPLWQAAAVFLIVTAPWYLAIYRLHGKAFIDAFLGFHNVNRFLEAEHKIGSQLYYNIPIILGGFFPWSVFLPFGLWRAFRKASGAGDTDRGPMLFLLAWFLVFFLFFTASSTKLPTYVFPCFISLALITGSLWDDFLSGRAGAAAGVKASYYILLAVVIAGAVVAPAAIQGKCPTLSSGAALSASFLVFGMALSAAMFAAKRYAASLLFIVYAFSIFLYPLSEFVIPPVERLESSQDVAQKLGGMMLPSERLGSESNYLAGLAFYADRSPVDLDAHHNIVQFMNSKERVWAVIKEKNHRQLYDPVINKQYVRPSYAVYRAGKRVIVTNEMPRDGKFLLRRERP